MSKNLKQRHQNFIKFSFSNLPTNHHCALRWVLLWINVFWDKPDSSPIIEDTILFTPKIIFPQVLFFSSNSFFPIHFKHSPQHSTRITYDSNNLHWPSILKAYVDLNPLHTSIFFFFLNKIYFCPPGVWHCCLGAVIFCNSVSILINSMQITRVYLISCLCLSAKFQTKSSTVFDIPTRKSSRHPCYIISKITDKQLPKIMFAESSLLFSRKLHPSSISELNSFQFT